MGELEFKGTPGPWRCNDNQGTYRTLILGDDTAGQTHTIAEVYEQYDDSHQEHPHARLIAAAPELLEALLPLVALWRDAEWTYEDSYYRFLKGGALLKWQAAEAAIAKALGHVAV